MKQTLLILLLWSAAGASPVLAQGVKLEKKPLTLPAYETGAPDVNPIFFTGRTYQGAQGHIYPYPLIDILTDSKTDRTYEALYVENDYVTVCVVPELGGRILSATDRTNGYEFFYRQTGVKPALIGMLGAWLSGGVEWNFPHHHRPSSFMDIDYRMEENADGSKTVWVGETELRHRFKWSVGVTLHPDRSLVEAKVRIMNRSPFIQSMLFWANVSVHCGEDYEVLFPPSTQFGADHSKVAFTAWPEGEIVRGSGETKQLGWWKNFTAGSRSIFAWNFEDDFLAGYDHAKQAGTMHVANHHVVNGKKFFLWGNNPGGEMWDKMLSDRDGPYLELMVGAFSDNQPDYSWIGPGEIREFSQAWYPIREIRGVKCANRDAAVNLERLAPGKVFIGFNATTVFKNAKVTLKSGEQTLFEQTVDIDPSRPFTREIDLPAVTGDRSLRAALSDAAGKELVAWQPSKPEDKPAPEAVEQVKPAEAYETVEELYQTGLRIEQFHNARLDPMDFYNEALKRDPSDSRVNTVVGIRHARQGKWALAEKHLLTAIERLTKNYTVVKDPEAWYNLGIVHQMQGRCAEAVDAFWKATWYPAFQSPAFFALAQIASARGDHAGALEHIDASLHVNARNTKALTVKACILRKLGKTAEALALLEKVFEIDPLDYWAQAEMSILSGRGARFLADADDSRGDGIVRQQELLEVVTDYGHIGAFAEALALLEEAIAAGEPYSHYPLTHYYAGYYAFLAGDRLAAQKHWQQAAVQPSDYCFPFRLEEIHLLKTALAENPSDARGFYYLGNLLYYLEQKDEGIEAWEESARLDDRFGLVHRNLGFAFNRAGLTEKAVAQYEKAILTDAGNPKVFTEIDHLYEKTGKPVRERLALMQKNLKTVMKHDDAVIRLLGLYNETGEYDKSIRIMDSRHFHVWEGGGEVHDLFVDAHLLKGLKLAAAKKYDAAIREYAVADTYPDNLEVGRPDNGGPSAKIYYCMGLAFEGRGDRAKAVECFAKASAGSQVRQRLWRSEQDVYRAMACQKQGNRPAADELLDACQQYVDEQMQSNSLIDEYSKFGEDGSQSQRLAQLFYLQGLIHYARGDSARADEQFAKALRAGPHMIWAKQLLNRGND
jgi:tetratricopeptide (TPR) repeat protein